MTTIGPDVVTAEESGAAWMEHVLHLRGVETVRWVGEDRPVVDLAAVAIYLLDPGIAPPACGAAQDWVRMPVDADELRLRGDRVLARRDRPAATAPAIDADGVLLAGDRAVVLSPQEGRLLGALLAAAGRLVPRDELVRATWPEGAPSDPRALDNRVRTIRGRLEGLPLRIHTLRGRGLLLEVLDAE